MHENFINETIDTGSLPQFEHVTLSPLQPDYWKVVIINISIIFLILAAGLAAAFYFIEEIRPYIVTGSMVYVILLAFTVLISRVSFKNKGYAFRTHDVIYRSGAIALTTTVIPYNRVQHVVLQEGVLSRKYGLAIVEVYTAGGSGSEVKIPGIEKDHAEKIKQLLLGKIQNQQEHE